MRKIRLLLFAFVLCGHGAFAFTIDQVFKALPEELNPMLNIRLRMELAEYGKAGLNDSVQNLFGTWTPAPVIDMERGYLCLSLARDTQLEMQFLRSSLDERMPLVVLIETVCAPVCSSLVSLYTVSWIKQPVQLPEFTALDFIDTDACMADSVDLEDIASRLPAYFIRAYFLPDSDDLVFSNETIQSLSAAEQEKYGKYVRTKRVTVF